ncbi:MAG TPA: formylmethanofuran dehydrogenase subunit C [Pirellulales bacterium]|nr:formylmethanofuran dehydrogenase subunit C [Pirellulales bacterium]
MPLQLKCTAASRLPIDFAGIIPERIRGHSLAEIERTEIFCGNRRLPLVELFSVAGESADGGIHLTGDLSSVHGIGCGMTQGVIRIEGSAGRHLGAEMRGGRIDVFGDAGDWAGAEMRGGAIHVHGNVADHAAGAFPGSLRGMTGGELLVAGNAGDNAGTAMRRGLVAIGGSAGDGLGSRMIAGTIIVGGQCGRHAGAAMRRGTIVLMNPASNGAMQLLPTFVRANQWNPPFLRLLLVNLQSAGFVQAERWIDSDYIVHHGDQLALNRGEILVRV